MTAAELDIWTRTLVAATAAGTKEPADVASAAVFALRRMEAYDTDREVLKTGKIGAPIDMSPLG